MDDKKLKSLTIFFPFYNDEGTVHKQIEDAYHYGGLVTNDLEVIALIGGNSKDNTVTKIQEAKIKHPKLVIVDKTDNTEGYAVIKHGLKAATKEWVFYTDGDAQYHLDDLDLLVKTQLKTKSDVTNGYKKGRSDNIFRILFGNLYAKFSNILFELPIRDTDCDFRLIKKQYLDKITLVSKDSSILAELLKKLQIVEATFSEVPVGHYSREYGTSNYTTLKLIKEKLIGDFFLYFKLRKMQGSERNLRLIRYAMVGVSSISVQIIIFNILLAVTKFHPGTATILSDQLVILTSFYFNNGYTFKDKKHTHFVKVVKAFSFYYAITMISTLIQASVVLSGSYFFGKGIITSNIFFVLGLVVAFIWNYTLNKHIVWK